MRFLADMGVSIMTVQALRAAAHDAVHLREQGLIRLPDPDIVAKAAQEQRVVLTFDLDFGDILAAARTGAPSVIIFRLRNQTPTAVNPRLLRAISDCDERTGKWCDHHRRGPGISRPAITNLALRRLGRARIETRGAPQAHLWGVIGNTGNPAPAQDAI